MRWLIIARGNEGDYVIGPHGCTCMAGTFGKRCKHIDEAERRGLMAPVEIGKAGFTRSFPSFLSSLNEIVGENFFNSDVIVAVHGKPGVGKSLYALHECANASAKGINFLYIDTEGGFKSLAHSWWDKLEKKFGIKEGSGKGYVETRKTLKTLHEFLGYRTDTVWVKKKERGEEETGKMEFRILESLPEPEIDSFIQKKDIGFVVVDSVSMPVATAINEEQQNRPARFTATALIMGKLAELQEKYGVCVLTIHHSSWNPQNPYETFAQMRGGKIVHHYSKRILYMDMRQKDELSDMRRLWLARAEDVAKFSDVAFLSIDDNGMGDIDAKTGYEAGLLTNSELEWVKDTARWQKVLKKR